MMRSDTVFAHPTDTGCSCVVQMLVQGDIGCVRKCCAMMLNISVAGGMIAVVAGRYVGELRGTEGPAVAGRVQA